VPKGTGGSWAQQLRYCVPFGFALILATLNKSLGGLFVTKMLGPIALAHYAIGVYAQPVITVLRNAISDVLLGEMAGRRQDDRAGVLALWRRSSVVTFIMIIPCGVLLARFADTIVTTLFSSEYRPAVPIFQIYVIALLRESFDFSVALRTINKTAPMLRSNLVALVLNAGLMLLLVPRWGPIFSRASRRQLRRPSFCTVRFGLMRSGSSARCWLLRCTCSCSCCCCGSP